MSKEFQVVVAFIVGALACVGIFSMYERETSILNNQRVLASQMLKPDDIQRIAQAINGLSQQGAVLSERISKLEGKKK